MSNNQPNILTQSGVFISGDAMHGDSGKQVLGVLMVTSVSVQGLLCLRPVDIKWFNLKVRQVFEEA